MSKSENTVDMKNIIRWLLLEKEDVHNDLTQIELSSSEPKVLDIGCDVGIETIALASILNSSVVIGIDKQPEVIAIAQSWLEEAEKYFRLSEDNGDTSNKVFTLFGLRRYPEFMVGDLISGLNLPFQVDLVYSRKVLVPIYENEYDNPKSGDQGVTIAIENLAKTLRSDGLAIVIEKNLRAYNNNKDFIPFFEQTGLKLIRCEPLMRFDILKTGKRSIIPCHYIRYVCRKT